MPLVRVTPPHPTHTHKHTLFFSTCSWILCACVCVCVWRGCRGSWRVVCLCACVCAGIIRDKSWELERGAFLHIRTAFFGGGGVSAFLSGLRGVTRCVYLSVCVCVCVCVLCVGESEWERWRERDRGITGVEGCLDRQSAWWKTTRLKSLWGLTQDCSEWN